MNFDDLFSRYFLLTRIVNLNGELMTHFIAVL